jgi:dTDP-4-dehydrorhamnose reductase
VNDQIGSPTYAADLAQAIMTIVAHSKWHPGIYNFSNEGEISWYEFVLAIQEIGKFDCLVNGIPSSEYPTPAKRLPFLYWIKRRLEKCMVLAFQIIGKNSLEKEMYNGIVHN